MARTKPALFEHRDRDGRLWTIRVGPLGIEAHTAGQYFPEEKPSKRVHVAWDELLCDRGTERGKG